MKFNLAAVVEDAKNCYISFGFQIEDQSRLHGEWISKTVGLKDVDAEYIRLTLLGDRSIF